MRKEILELLNEMRFEEKAPGLYAKTKNDNADVIIGINFKKFTEKGAPFAKEGDNFYDDLVGITELDDFIKRRDEILQSSGSNERQNVPGDTDKQQGTENTNSSLDMGQKRFSPVSPSGVKIPSVPTSNLLKVIKNDYEADILEIFGDSGTCKTKLAVLLAQEGKRDGMKVKFIDTERNLRKAEIASLGDSYQYLPGINDLNNFCKNLPKDPDVIIIDSIGYPILTEFAKMTANQKGASLLNMIAWFGDLKDWAINNNKLVIVTNQPDSDFGKATDYVNKPFGDKARFAAKEIWELKRLGMKQGITTSNIQTFRSRIKGYGLTVAQNTNHGRRDNDKRTVNYIYY